MAWAKARGALAVTSTTTSASPPVAVRSAATGSSTAHVDREVGTKGGGAGEAIGVALTVSGDHHEAGTGVAGGRRRAQPAHTRTEHGDDLAGPRLRQVDRPADARSERVEHRRQHRIEACGDGQQHRIRPEEEMGGVPAPQPRVTFDVDEPDHRGEAVADATTVVACTAGVARATRLEHLDGDPITALHTPALRRPCTDLLDDADHLVTGDEGMAGRDVPRVLLVVCPTQATGLDAHEPVTVVDVGEIEPAQLELARRGEDEPCGPHESIRSKAARVARIASTARGRPA